MASVELGQADFRLNVVRGGILPDAGAGDTHNIRSVFRDQQHTVARRQESAGPSTGFCARVIFDLGS